ncbi:MATE family efflux transporter [Candidatus Dependentiae bacterium]|nr:MATE family efflux transporter [Candidatus Dependentiae bacterium]MCC7414713.1 MATE family efflux transporter [Campylobacterota bacterium]
MKKGLLASYVSGLSDREHGESYDRIIRYFIPEFITSLLLYSMLSSLDAYFIGYLKSTTTYGVLGATKHLIHFITKIAEALSVGTIILSGRYNGMSNFAQSGRTLRDAFWLTCILGATVASFLFFGAHYIYTLYVPADMVGLGVPFLRLRALGVFLMFIALAFVGFLRGVKNTKAPMFIFIVGALAFVFFDYGLIFGAFGLPALGLQGSAWASVIQYTVITIMVITYVMYNPDYRKYGISLLGPLQDGAQCKELLRLSWPVLLDKATMAFAYIWLVGMMKPLGARGVAAFCVLQDMERFALIPAIAFAQVSTFLVSNDFGMENWQSIKNNVKKIMFLASIVVFSILFLFSINARTIIGWFDRKHEFTDLAAQIFPFVSAFAFFDLLQLVLSGALRGAGNVRIVMYSRLAVFIFYFIPISYGITKLPIEDISLRILLLFGSFYVGNALMSIVYIQRFRSGLWKTLK